MYVHLDVEGGWLSGRPRLPGHLVDKLTCAGTVQPVWQQGGVPVSVGRALRIVPERTRRLVLDRDRGLPFSRVCGAVRIWRSITWSTGPTGAGRTWRNLVGLCPFHHDAHHRGEFSIGGDANTCGRVGVPGPGRVPDRAGPDLRTDTASETGSTAGSAQVWTIGVSTERPDGLGPGPTS